MTCSVICDYLDVTTPPECSTVDNVFSLLSLRATDLRGDPSNLTMSIGDGTVKLTRKKIFNRISASGSALAHLRAHGLFHRYLDSLASGPHKITRLDCARDTPEDFADLLPKLRRRYRNKKVFLSRKGLPIKFITSLRDSDNRETGTFYAGHRTKSRLTARIYDKSNQLYEQHGEISSEPITRAELTVKSDVGATLRDASEPDRIFWHFMKKDLLRSSYEGNIPDWSPDWAQPWEASVSRRDPASKIDFLIENSEFLDALISVSDELGPHGRDYLIRQLERRCRSGFSVKSD